MKKMTVLFTIDDRFSPHWQISRQLDKLRSLTLEAGDALKMGDELTNRSYEEILKVQRNLDKLGF